MRTIVYLETNDEYIYIAILKKDGIEHKYKLFRNTPSFNRLVRIVEYYSTRTAYLKLYPNDIFSITLEGNPHA